ncbi:hypothetical protein X474_26210 [Dethiosulfatarculus sandiegensis]|uniref:Uncharacterized protein n=1 Tax=Dethiosulfatarculus sandiegensis TaxID=1429043 RepID=A0A0D2IZ28_9BACT|nr:hypothetical protein X474_26210 [Dethiosulfatarculus sandiegensis]
MKKYAEALQAINQAIQILPEYHKFYLKRGDIYLELKEYDLALSDYNKYLTHKPDSSSALYNRGLAFLKLKRYPDSIKDFSRAIEVKPKYYKVYIKRAKACSILGETQKRNQNLLKAFKLKLAGYM